jgi:hypothetical protein
MYVVPQGAAASTGADSGIQSEPPPAPEHLSEAERAVWERYAPLAHGAGMLPPAKEPGFEHLCEIVATYQALKQRIDSEGWTFMKVTVDGSGQEHQEEKRHALWSQLQTFAVRRESALRSYGLFANGRPASTGAPSANPWSTI